MDRNSFTYNSPKGTGFGPLALTALGLSILFLTPFSALAESASYRTGVNGYTGTEDVGISNLYAASYNNYNGYTNKSGSMSVQNSSYSSRVLLRFKGLSIPSGATLTRAQLSMTVNTWTSGFNLKGYYLSSVWDAAANIGWNYRTATATWLKGGAFGSSSAPDTLSNSPFVISGLTASGNQVRTFDLDVNVVKSWLASSSANQGILLLNDTSSKTATILSSEDSTLSNRPQLTLTLTVGEVQTITRVDAEPAGSNCLYGGTATRTGKDFNGDGVLQSDEVQSVTYQCSAPFTSSGTYSNQSAAGTGGRLRFAQGVSGYIGTQDAWITDQYAADYNQYNGRSETSGSYSLSVGDGTSSTWSGNGLLRFDGIDTVMPKGATLTRARVTLTIDNWATLPTINVHGLKTRFNTATSSLGWRYRDSSVEWSGRGASGSSDRDANPMIAFQPGTGTLSKTLDLDVATVSGWLAGSSANAGLLLRVTEQGKTVTVHSAEDSNLSYRPSLELSYQLGTPDLSLKKNSRPEPWGPNCLYGGTAVQEGPDFDGSGALDEDEVTSRRYECDAPVVTVDPNGKDVWSYSTYPQEGSASQPFATIGYAFAHAPDGATIIVRPGTYVGNVRLDGRYLEQGITVRSEIPYAAKLRHHEQVIFVNGGSNVTVEGFDIAQLAPTEGTENGPHVVHVQWDSYGYTFRNNIIHDSWNGDGLKVNMGAHNVLIEGNIFYNIAGKQVFLDSISDILVQDNVLFDDFEGAGRAVPSTVSSYVVVTNNDGSKKSKSQNVTIRRNVFAHWQGQYGQNFILMGQDGRDFYEASDILIENNLMLGDSAMSMRSPIGCKGAEDVLVRHNTLVGNFPGDAFLARLNTEGQNLPNKNILFYNNIFSDPTGTMNRLTTTPAGQTTSWALDHNLYFNAGQALPFVSTELINPVDDAAALVLDPGLNAPALDVLPRLSTTALTFEDGSSTIEEVRQNLIAQYGIPANETIIADQAREDQTSSHDILGHVRESAGADHGALELSSDQTLADVGLEDGTADFSGAGWIPGHYVIETACGADTQTLALHPDWSLRWTSTSSAPVAGPAYGKTSSGPALSLTRDEPRGTHCRFGGLATLTGNDANLSGALDSSEVAMTSYACTTTPTLWVAEDGVDSYVQWEDGSEARPFRSINFALYIIEDGGEIVVKPGTYTGQTGLDMTFARGITIRSQVPYAAKLRNDAMVIKNFYGQGYTIEGFDVAHCGPGADYHLVHIQDGIDGSGGTMNAGRTTLRNNIFHDAYLGDLVKVNNGAEQVRVQGNLFYNPQAKHLHLNTVQDVVVEDNVFFNDYEGSGRVNDNSSSSYISVMSSLYDSDYVAERLTIRRNVFMSWAGSAGAYYIVLGSDGLPIFEATDVLIENNLMLGNPTGNLMRSPFGCKGAKDVLFRNNTVTGDGYAQEFAMRLNTEESNPANENIRMVHNVWSDPTGTMGRFSTTPYGETSSFRLQGNAYFNGGNTVPSNGSFLVNPEEDSAAVYGDPALGSQSGLINPRWDAAAGQFADGSSSIRGVRDALVARYGTPASSSVLVGQGSSDWTAEEDILGRSRSTSGATIGAFEAGASSPVSSTVSSDDLDAGWVTTYAALLEADPIPQAPVTPGIPVGSPDDEVTWNDGQLFPVGNPWNIDVSQAALDPESTQVIDYLQEKGFGLGRFQIDFSITVLEANENTGFQNFIPTADFYSPDCDRVEVPVPVGGALEGEEGYSCDNDGDCHLIVNDHSTGLLYEMWRADIQDGVFYGGCLAVWDTQKVYTDELRGDQCSSADAGGFPIASMLFSADEVAAGEVNHAIRFILPNDRIRAGVMVRPATHATTAASGGKSAPAYGARLRLRSDFPLESLPNDAARTVAKALMKYGMILSDGGSVALTAQSDRYTEHKWAGLMGPHDLGLIQPRDFQVVDGGARIPLTYDCKRTK